LQKKRGSKCEGQTTAQGNQSEVQQGMAVGETINTREEGKVVVLNCSIKGKKVLTGKKKGARFTSLSLPSWFIRTVPFLWV